jgi:hypothetical protein
MFNVQGVDKTTVMKLCEVNVGSSLRLIRNPIRNVILICYRRWQTGGLCHRFEAIFVLNNWPGVRTTLTLVSGIFGGCPRAAWLLMSGQKSLFGKILAFCAAAAATWK